MRRITVLGLGEMGSRIAQNLLDEGHEVTVWNRSPQKASALVAAGAIAAKTPRDAVSDAEFAISMVRDDQASQQVWLDADTGALAGLSDGAVAIESSTLSVDWTRRLGQHFQRPAVQTKGIAFVDAPVAGSRPQAEAAQLIYFVVGDIAALEKARPILMTLGRAVHPAGAIGNGMAIKLAVNALFGIQAVAMGELIGLMCDYGLAAEQAVDILTTTPVCSPAAKALASAMVARKFDPLFPIALVEKDLSYACKQDTQVLPMVKAAQEAFLAAISAGYGEQNITGIAQLYTSSSTPDSTPEES